MLVTALSTEELNSSYNLGFGTLQWLMIAKSRGSRVALELKNPAMWPDQSQSTIASPEAVVADDRYVVWLGAKGWDAL